MGKIIINQKICDRSPECDGIAVCPTGALSFDTTLNKVVWAESKCIFCLACTLPDACPVGAIMFARDDVQEKEILDTIASDSRTEGWLWQERYGVEPSPSQPSALPLTPHNFNTVLADGQDKLIDIWHPDFLDCRLHSPLFSDILNGLANTPVVYKLDAKTYPELANQLDITVFPSLLAYQKGLLYDKIEGPLTDNSIINCFKIKN